MNIARDMPLLTGIARLATGLLPAVVLVANVLTRPLMVQHDNETPESAGEYWYVHGYGWPLPYYETEAVHVYLHKAYAHGPDGEVPYREVPQIGQLSWSRCFADHVGRVWWACAAITIDVALVSALVLLALLVNGYGGSAEGRVSRLTREALRSPFIRGFWLSSAVAYVSVESIYWVPRSWQVPGVALFCVWLAMALSVVSAVSVAVGLVLLRRSGQEDGVQSRVGRYVSMGKLAMAVWFSAVAAWLLVAWLFVRSQPEMPFETRMVLSSGADSPGEFYTAAISLDEASRRLEEAGWSAGYGGIDQARYWKRIGVYPFYHDCVVTLRKRGHWMMRYWIQDSSTLDRDAQVVIYFPGWPLDEQ